MPEFQLDIAIERPPDEVFAYLTDFDRQPDWQPGVLASSHTPPGPPQVSTRVWKLRTTPMGHVSFTDEVTEFDPARRSCAERVVQYDSRLGQSLECCGQWGRCAADCECARRDRGCVVGVPALPVGASGEDTLVGASSAGPRLRPLAASCTVSLFGWTAHGTGRVPAA